MNAASFGMTRILAVPLLVGCLMAAGCGNGEQEAEPTEKEEAPIAYARCMREQGFDAPDPSPGERGFGFVIPEPGSDEEEFEEAHDECLREIEATYAFLSEDTEQVFDKLVLWAQCLRDRGVDTPDPDPAKDPGPGEYIKRVADPGDPEFEEGDNACREEVFGGPDQGPGGERGPGGGDDPR